MAFSNDIQARLGLDNRPFQKGLRGAQAQVKKFAAVAGSALAGIGFARLGRRLLSFADDLKTAAATAQVSVEFLQEFRFAAEQVGVSSEKATKGLGAFAKRAGEAAQGTGQAKDAFEQLGIEVRKADGQLKSTEQLIFEIADSFSNLEDGVTKAQIASDLFSRTNQELINVLNEGVEGLRKFSDEAKVVSEEDVETLDLIDKKIKALQDTSLKWAASLAFEVAPVVEKVFKGVRDAVQVAFAPIRTLTAFFGGLSGPQGSLQNAFQAAGAEIKDVADQAVNIFNQESSIAKSLKKTLEEQTDERVKGADAAEDATKAQERQKELSNQQQKAEERIAKLTRERAQIQDKLGQRRMDRLQFGNIQSLAQSNLRAARFFGAPSQFFQDVQSARQVVALEQQARFAKSVGRLATSQQLFGRADEIRKGIVALSPSARDPAKIQREQLKRLDNQIQETREIVENTKALRNAEVR